MTTMTDDDTEVRGAKRAWPAQCKLDILSEIEDAKDSGDSTVAEICRREGLYSSLISEWCKQRDAGAVEGLKTAKSGHPKKDLTQAGLSRLRADNDKLSEELETVHELDVPPQRRNEHQAAVTDLIEAWAPLVGVARACRAFGVAERTFHHRRQGAQARLALRPSRARTAEEHQGVPWRIDDGDRAEIRDGDTWIVYGPGGQPVSQVNADNSVDWLHHDQIGSVRLTTNGTGAVTSTSAWDPYGNPTASTGTGPLLGYTGQYSDAETGLTYLRARYYDPTTNQFLTQDPLVAQTHEPYGYTGSDPINFTDPLGLNKCEVGYNPLRWGGNAVDCVSKADPTEVVEVVNEVSNVVAAGAGICMAAGAASIIGAPVAAGCAAVAGGALAVNLGTGAALTVTESKSGGSYALDVVLAGLGYGGG